jgi:hypothetical protein
MQKLPDPRQNVIEPQHCYKLSNFALDTLSFVRETYIFTKAKILTKQNY